MYHHWQEFFLLNVFHFVYISPSKTENVVKTNCTYKQIDTNVNTNNKILTIDLLSPSMKVWIIWSSKQTFLTLKDYSNRMPWSFLESTLNKNDLSNRFENTFGRLPFWINKNKKFNV